MEARAQATEIVYAGWLDEAAKGTPEDPAADRSSEDATITPSRIMLSMAATKVIEKEQHHSTSDGWRSMTTWNKYETNKCWEEVKNILTGKLVIGVPMTYVSENHGYLHENRGTNFPSSGSDAESNETGCVRMAHSDRKIMPQIRPTWYGGEMTGKRISCRAMCWSLLGFESESNSRHVEHMARLWRLKLGSKETPTLVTKATGRRRDIDETLMQHDVRASREGSWNKLSSNEIIDTGGNLAVQTPGSLENAASMSEHTSGSRRSDQGNCVKHCGRNSMLRCEAIVDQTDTRRKSESHGTVRRLPEMASSWRVRVASLGSTQGAASERVRVAPPRSEQWLERVAPPELMGGSSRTVLTAKQTSQILEQIGTGAEARATFGNSAICETCDKKADRECGRT